MNSNSRKLTARRVILRFGVGLVLAIIQSSLILSCSAIARIIPTRAVQPPSTIEDGWSVQPETNFGFILQYGLCYTNKLDTFRDKFTQEQGIETSITIPLKLSVEQLKMIYQKMYEINLTQYPAIYSIPLHPGKQFGIVTPASRYNLAVVNGKSTTTISWTDAIIEPTAPEADRLRELMRMIIRMIYENPDVRELPEPKSVCA